MAPKTIRRILIATGIPLAAVALAWGILFGGVFALLAAMGMYIAMRTIDLIYAA